MPVFDFSFVLDANPHDDSVVDVLMDEPFSDSTFIFQNGELALSFDREADTLDDAVRSARDDILRTGIPILRLDT